MCDPGTISLIVSAATTVASGLLQSDATQKAADTQADAAKEAAAEQSKVQKQNIQFQKEALQRFDPFLQAGEQALGQLQGSIQQPIGSDPFTQFRLQQNMNQAQQMGASTGNVGRATQIGLQNAAGITGQEVQRRQGILQSLVSGGRAAAGGFGPIQAQPILTGILGQGQAQASAQLAQGNIYGQTMQGLGMLPLIYQSSQQPTQSGAYGYQQLMNLLPDLSSNEARAAF